MNFVERVKAYRAAGYCILAILGMIFRRIRKGHWSVWVEEMFRETGVVIDTETSMTNYQTERGGRLVQVIIDPGGIAATSLIESGHVRIETVNNPDVVAPFHGIGLETVPRQRKAFCVTDCDIPVKASGLIKGKYYYNVLPVTPELVVYGKFVG